MSRPSLAPDWRHRLRRYWSLRIAFFWSGLSGLISIWSAFEHLMPLWLYALLSVLMTGAMGIAVLTKQPGAHE